jgi:hypothetical protein
MTFIDRLQALFRLKEQQEQPVTLASPPARPSSLIARFGAERGRRAMVEEARGMYDEDARADGVIDTLARDAVKGGFVLHIEGQRADEASDIANELFAALDITNRIDDWARLTLRDGDTFLEVATNAQGRIIHASRKPTLEMHRWSDDFDRFHDPYRAYFWTDKLFVGTEPPQSAVYFAEWQIVHARYARDEGSRYGRPLFASARKAYKRMSEGELDIAIRRKTRAGMKYIHSLEDASDADIEAYRERNKEALDDPFAAIADFFSNKRTAISAVQGDARLAEIDDVLHHIDTWAVASPVPLELIGYGRNINRDVLEQKKEQYDDALQGFRGWLTVEFIKPLLERQWLLAGIWPPGLVWSVVWKAKKALTPAGVSEISKALLALRATGLFRDETLLHLFGSLYPDFDVEAELQALKEARPDEIGRMAGEADDETE